MIIISPIVRMALKIASMILFAITILASYGGYINPEYMTAPSVLVLAFPYLAIATLVVGVCWLFKGSIFMTVLAALTLAACWSTIKEATPVSFSKNPKEGNKTFRVMTFNCLHLADTTHQDAPGNRAITFLVESGADIICLQELRDFEDAAEIHHWSRSLIDSLYAKYPYRAGKTDIDLKILSKYPVKALDGGKYWPLLGDADSQYARRRWRLFEVDIDGFSLPILDFHLDSYSLSDEEREVVVDIRGVRTAKNSYREFRREIFPKMGEAFRIRANTVDRMIESMSDIKTMIACGDFNDVPGSWAYRQMRKAGFQDAYAETGFGPANTFNQFLFLFHIDQIFYRGPGLRAIDTKKHRINTSDHYPVEATFEIIGK